MDINIQTKFNIGDKVWVPSLYYDDWFVVENYIVGIEIKIDNFCRQTILYVVKDDRDIIEKCPPAFCFASYDECKQWCQRR